jgi:predicted hotdog family 3-hydroxylacyl-ACP dehydratase
MVLLSGVVAHDQEQTICEAEVDRLVLFRRSDGSVGAWIGIELMAQCIAAHAGLTASLHNETPRIGFLLGSRRVTFHVPRYVRGQCLRIRAARTWGGPVGMVAFDCSIEDQGQRVLAEARLNCFLPENPEALAV